MEGLLGEGPHHPDARERLLQVGGDRPDRLAGAPEGAGGDQAEPQRPPGQEGEHAERDQRELQVQRQQDHRRTHQRQAGLEQRHHRVGHEAVERLHVIGHARDQHPGRATLVEADRQRLQVGEDADAKIRQRALADPADEIGLQVGHHPHHQRRGQEGDDDHHERGGVAVGDALVDRHLGQQRWREHGRRAGPVRPQQREQPAQVSPACSLGRALPGPLGAAEGSTRGSPSHRRAHSPLTSRSRGLRVRNTWSGSPLATISAYSSELLSSCPWSPCASTRP